MRKRAWVGLAVCFALATGCAGGSSQSASTGVTKAVATAPAAATGTIVVGVKRDTSERCTSTAVRMRPDGSARQVLYRPSCYATLSPDGTMLMDNIVLSETRYRVGRYRVSGGRLHLLSIPRPNGPDLGVGAWSPDGKRMACETERGIYTYRTSDGGGERRLTADGVPAAYSPDGTRLLYLRPASGADGPEPDMNLWVVSADGRRIVRINPKGTTVGFTDTPVVSSQSWSPDGRRIAFVAAEGSYSANGDTRAIYVANRDGSDAHPITPFTSTFSAQWSPDGRWIAFDQPSAGSRDLFVVHPDGSGLREVTTATNGTYSFGPVWSPDSHWLLFVRGTGNSFDHTDLWIARSDGSGLTQVTHDPAGYLAYSWSSRS